MPYAPVATELGTLLTLTAQGTGSVNSAKFTNAVATGLALRLYVTAETGTTPTVTLTVQGYDTASSQWYAVGASTAFAVAASTMYTVNMYPGSVAGTSPTEGINAALPAIWRVQATVGGTTPAVTATIGGCTLV
jgi:hypothetical protein